MWQEWQGDEYSMCVTDDMRLIITHDDTNESVVRQYEWWEKGNIKYDAEFFAQAMKMHKLAQRRAA